MVAVCVIVREKETLWLLASLTAFSSSRSLRPKGVLQLFAAILQEGRILLHSTKPALLAAVAEGVFALMYPLQWPYAYVPVLPK